jgi:hypothetical protein
VYFLQLNASEKYVYGIDGSLVVMNILKEDEGSYVCKSGDVTLREHSIRMSGMM